MAFNANGCITFVPRNTGGGIHEGPAKTHGGKRLKLSGGISTRRPGRLQGRRREKNDFLHLHTECVAALENYVAEADKLCQMLARAHGDAIGVTEHVSLLAQRERESEAHAEYLRARKRLLRRARLSRRAFAGCCDIATVAANS